MDLLWSCVLRLYKFVKSMMPITPKEGIQEPLISDIINRVLVIDDSEEDIKNLKSVLEPEDITVDSCLPQDLKGKTFRRNRQLIFMDLYLDPQVKVNHNIDTIISILSNNIADTFGLYGLVIWTTSVKDVERVKTRIGATYKAYLESLDKEKGEGLNADEIGARVMQIKPPLFIVNLNKKKYLEEMSYANLLPDLQQKIREDTAACFFTSWYGSVVKGVSDSIQDVYKLAPEYPNQKNELAYLLYKLGINHVGVNEENNPPYDKIGEDAFKAFDELLVADLNSQNRISQQLKDAVIKKPWDGDPQRRRLISAQLNAKLFIDARNISKQEIVPGNVYKILDGKSPLRVTEKPELVTEHVTDFINVAIELTPPCDYSHKKIGSRLVGGYAFVVPNINADTVNKIAEKIDEGDKLYSLWLVLLDDKVMAICFDFRYLLTPAEFDIKNEKSYQLWFRAKPRLFADILQKFSSHAARLGLSNIDLS